MPERQVVVNEPIQLLVRTGGAMNRDYEIQ